jgi:hypothetical protein
MTGPNGMAFEDYKKLFDWWDSFDLQTIIVR